MYVKALITMQQWGSQDLGKNEMLIKNKELTNFSCLKSNSRACRWVCAFADVFGGIGKG
jgi:hypothetical protein